MTLKLNRDQANQMKAVCGTLALALILLLSAWCSGCSLFEDEEDEEITYITIPSAELLHTEGRCCELCATNRQGEDLRCVSVCPCPLDEDEQTDEEE